MDVFPISGDTQKNSFHFKQIKGEFFGKVMKNFIFNTEGGQSLRISNFCRFAVDHSDETRAVTPFCYTIVVIYLWHTPEDMFEIMEEFVNIKDKPIVFWFVYLGQDDQDAIQTVDGRKAYVVGSNKTIGIYCKSMTATTSYKTEPQVTIRKLLIDTAHVFAYHVDK